MSGHCAENTLGEKNATSEYVNRTEVMSVDGYSGLNNGVHLSGERCFYGCIDDSCIDKERFTD